MQTVYTFGGGGGHDDPRAKDKTVVGGKGANLAEMAAIGLPVPPGFTITTEECLAYNVGGKTLGPELKAAVREGIRHIETRAPERTETSNGTPAPGTPKRQPVACSMCLMPFAMSAFSSGPRVLPPAL